MTDITNPLTEQHKQDIENSLARIREAKELMDKAERSDIDVTEQRRKIDAQEAQLLKIKQNFFPNG